jgi:hypothetical protein
MGMIGSGLVLPVATVPTALADAMAVLRVISDPETAKANLDAWVTLADQVQAAAGDVERREKDTAAREAALGEAANKLDADREAHTQAVAAHRDKAAELTAQQKAIASEQKQLGQAQARATQLDDREKSLNARESAITAGEIELNARRDKLAEALRV